MKTIGKDWLLWAIYLVAAAVTVITESEQVLLFVAASILVWLVKSPPKWWRGGAGVSSLLGAPFTLGLAGVPAAADTGTLWNIFTFFAKAGAFVFGSGLAIVPFLYGGVVKEHAWLTDHQFLDACLFTIIPAPYFKKYGKRPDTA